MLLEINLSVSSLSGHLRVRDKSQAVRYTVCDTGISISLKFPTKRGIVSESAKSINIEVDNECLIEALSVDLFFRFCLIVIIAAAAAALTFFLAYLSSLFPNWQIQHAFILHLVPGGCRRGHSPVTESECGFIHTGRQHEQQLGCVCRVCGRCSTFIQGLGAVAKILMNTKKSDVAVYAVGCVSGAVPASATANRVKRQQSSAQPNRARTTSEASPDDGEFDDSSECGFPTPITITQGPSTLKFAYAISSACV